MSGVDERARSITRVGVVLLAVVVALVGCSLGPSGPGPAAGLELLIQVENLSALPATLIVAREAAHGGPGVRQAAPRTVAPGERSQLLIVLPPTNEWALFVNPRPGFGPLITAHDLRRCSGRLPLEIQVQPGGAASWATRQPCLDP